MYYTRHTWRPSGLGGHGMNVSLPPGIKLLLISNIAVFVLQWFAYSFIVRWFGLVPLSIQQQGTIWQLGTYMFLHGGPFHILINMFMLWMFGREIELAWGTREFLKYYFVCGIGAGIITFLFMFESPVPTIGASGAVFGVMLAFAMMYPNRLLLLFFLIPVKVKYVIIFYALLTFYAAFSSAHDGVAHFTHLGGFAVGFLYLKLDWRPKAFLHQYRDARRRRKVQKIRRNVMVDRDFMEKVDRVLDRINDVGYENLTAEEKRILDQASQKMSSAEDQ